MQFLLCNYRWKVWNKFFYREFDDDLDYDASIDPRKLHNKKRTKKKFEGGKKGGVKRGEEMLVMDSQEPAVEEVNKPKTRSVVRLEQMGFSSSESGSSLERALAFDVLARVLALPEGTVLKLEIPVIKEGERVVETQDIELNLEAFREDKDGEIFKALARHFWQDLAAHGIEQASKEVGQQPKMLQYSDADGELCLRFMREAGIKSPGIEYVKKGDHATGKVTVDSGGKNGIFVELNWVGNPGEERWVVTTRVDHHGEGDDASPSAAEIIYKALVGLGLLESKVSYEKAVEFLNATDSGNIPGVLSKEEMPNYFKNKFAKSLYGLQEFLTGEDIITVFKMNGKPLEELSPKQKEAIKTKGFTKAKEGETKIDKRIAQVQEKVNKSITAIEKLIAEGCVLETEKYGRILVDIGGTVPLTARAARLMGFDGYINWKPEDKFFMVVADNKIDFDLKDGIKVRNMWIKKDGAGLEIGLGDIVKEMKGEKGRLGKGLETYLGVTAATEETKAKERLVWYDEILEDLDKITLLDDEMVVNGERLREGMYSGQEDALIIKMDEVRRDTAAKLRKKGIKLETLSIDPNRVKEYKLRRDLRAAVEYLREENVSQEAREVWKTRAEAVVFLNGIGIGDRVGVDYLPDSEDAKEVKEAVSVPVTENKEERKARIENMLIQLSELGDAGGEREAILASLEAEGIKVRKFLADMEKAAPGKSKDLMLQLRAVVEVWRMSEVKKAEFPAMTKIAGAYARLLGLG